jgi:hypothetical protein
VQIPFSRREIAALYLFAQAAIRRADVLGYESCVDKSIIQDVRRAVCHVCYSCSREFENSTPILLPDARGKNASHWHVFLPVAGTEKAGAREAANLSLRSRNLRARQFC